MAQLDHYIGIYDNVFNDDECNKLIAKFKDLEANSSVVDSGANQFPQGKLGRSDSSFYFEQVARQEADVIHTRVGECMNNYMTEYVGLNNVSIGSFCCKVQKTEPKGGFHVWHSEHGPDYGSFMRVTAWLLYLTSHEGEGETEFLQQGMRVEPKAGRVVIWPASFTHPHRGNPVYNEDKYIATGWFQYLSCTDPIKRD